MPLQIHRASRADQLADGLGQLLRTPLPDPFASELVVVPAKGVERWLSQRLSHVLGAASGADDGVCAGIELRSPASLVAEVTGRPDEDPWAPDRMVWPLLDVVDASADEEWCRPLSRHLGLLAGASPGSEDELRRGRRYATARRLGGLFASYARQRPALLRAWEAGRDEDGAGEALPDDLGWQPELWRRLLAARGEASPTVRHAAVLRALETAPATGLPSRLSLFGHTRIPVTEAELLAALGTHHDVHLWLPHPSPALWDALTAMLSATSGPVPREDDTSATAARHSLLASLGRDVRELERTLLPHARDAGAAADPVRPEGLLGRLQEDVARDDLPAAAGRTLDPADRSVQVHACHGPARQVEVLREVVLGLLAEHEDLEPRDIVVMCPDIEAYAPLIEAAFGLGDAVAGAHPGQQLQVRLADRALTRTNPLLAVAGSLLDLADGRAPASLVLDLLATEPVRRRFRVSESELETVHRWIEQSGVRWAFDAGHRAPYGLQAYPQNTWRFGLDRVLAGVAVSEDAQSDGPGYVDTVLPLDDVPSSSIDLAGRLSEMVDRLQRVVDRLDGLRPVEQWLDALREGTLALAAVEPGEEWQLAQLQTELGGGAAPTGDGAPDLRLSDVRSLLGDRLGGRPTRANFRTGTLTVCTMVPMRSVPHRVVCLLGVDDGVFPRAAVADGDDVLARRPLTGERDARSEDRQQLLDAVMAATQTLVVTYSGFDETTGAERPPAVPLGELLDVLDRTVPGARDHVVTEHKIQPFHRSYFDGEGPRSFDGGALRAARATTAARTVGASARFEALLDPPAAADVEIADLVAFLKTPVATFLRERLEVATLRSRDELTDRMPIELDGLQAWGVGDRLLRQLLAGRDPQEALHREWRRGDLPPGPMGWRRLKALADSTTPIAEAADAVRAGEPESAVEISVELPDLLDVSGRPRRVVGAVGGLHRRRRLTAGYSRVGAKQELDAWVHLVALEAAHPGRGWTSTAVGRGGQGGPVASITFAPPADAVAALTALVQVRDEGMRGPLPLPVRTAYAWAQRRATGVDDEQCAWAAADEWSPFRFSGENAEAAHVMVWGERASLEQLRSEPPHAGEEWAGESDRFAALAGRVWSGAFERRSRS